MRTHSGMESYSRAVHDLIFMPADVAAENGKEFAMADRESEKQGGGQGGSGGQKGGQGGSGEGQQGGGGKGGGGQRGGSGGGQGGSGGGQGGSGGREGGSGVVSGETTPELQLVNRGSAKTCRLPVACITSSSHPAN